MNQRQVEECKSDGWYTIDSIGLNVLHDLLTKEFEGQTVFIKIIPKDKDKT